MDRNEDADILITKTLRRWRPLLSGVSEEKTERFFQRMEMQAAQPPGIGWNQSGSPTSASRPLAWGSSYVIQLNSNSILLLNFENNDGL